MLKRSFTVLGLAFLLTACGFHLRGTGTTQMALSELNFAARDAFSPLGKQVTESLANTNVTISSSAPFTLYLGAEENSRRTASFTPGTRSAEYTLTSSANYELRSGSLPALIQDSVKVQRVMRTRHVTVLAGRALLRQEMRAELVMQLMMRLQAVNPTQLQGLQDQAQRRQDAEAQARDAAIRAQRFDEPQQSPISLP